MASASKYLVRPQVEEDWVDSTRSDSELSVCLMKPVGHNDMMEVRDGIYDQDKGEAYHQHTHGCELFFLPKGTVEIVIRGKSTVLQAGDFLYVPTGVPHAFHFPGERTTLRLFLQGVNIYGRRIHYNRIRENYPQLLEDPEFAERFALARSTFKREEPVTTPVDRRSLPEVRTPDAGLSEFTLPGAVLRQVLGRWETSDMYEVWRVEARKGLRVRWDMPHDDWELYQVTEGCVRFHVLQETFEAHTGELVRIPPYTTYDMEVLEERTVVHDMGCSVRLLSFLEDRLSVLTNKPELWKDEAYRHRFFIKYNCFVTSWEYEN